MTYSLFQLDGGGALSAQESAELAARVASLASSGMPLEAGLLALADELPGPQLVLQNLETRLSRGEPFEQAIQANDARLPATLRGLIAAGLRSGRLPQVLDEYASLIRRQQALRQRATLTLIYPALLSCMMAALMVVIRFGVVGDMQSLFKDFATSLPGLTVFVFWATPYAMWVVVDIAVVFCLAAAIPNLLVRIWPFSILVDYLPVVGSMSRYRRLAAASEMMAMLLENGVPAPEALELAAAASDSSRLTAALRAAADGVRQGKSLDQALATRGLPQRLAYLVEWGQESNDVAASLRAAADSFESQLQIRRHLTEAITAPLFFLVITFGAGLIVLAIMMPLMGLITHLSGGGLK